MPTSLEKIDAATAKLDSLLSANAESAAEPTEKVVEMTAADALKAIASELAHPETLTKERLTYLNSVANEIGKSSFAPSSETANGTISIKVTVSPDQVKTTSRTISLQALFDGTLGTALATATKQEKAEAISKLLLDREALKKLLASDVQKSALTDKMDDILSMFSLTPDDLADTYEARYKIGDLITLLQNAIKLERLLGSADTSTEKSETPAPEQHVWPRDMAGAKFDPASQKYAPDTARWKE